MKPEEIKELMELTGWSRVDLAQKLMVCEATVIVWLKRGAPKKLAASMMRDWLRQARATAEAIRA